MEHESAQPCIGFGLIGGFGLLIAVCAMVIIATLSSIDADRLVDHSMQVRQTIQQLLSALENAETGQRGYLLADDVGVSALEELGYDTLAAANAASARELLSTDPNISVMLTDVIMPGTNGKQLHDAVKDSHPDLTVLFMTGYTRNAIVHNGMLDASVRLITKPFTIDDLAREMRATVAAGNTRSEPA